MVTTLSVSWLLLDRILEMSLSSRIPSGCYEICGSALRECRLLSTHAADWVPPLLSPGLPAVSFLGKCAYLGLYFLLMSSYSCSSK